MSFILFFYSVPQQEGYEAALGCDGERLDSTQIRVEVCKSAGAAPKRKRENGAEDRRRQDARHAGSAPKVGSGHSLSCNSAFWAVRNGSKCAADGRAGVSGMVGSMHAGARLQRGIRRQHCI